MGYNLFLDDERAPINAFNYTNDPIYHKWEWIVVKSYNEFVSYIETHGLPSFISYDHDLGDILDENEKTGFHCSKWIVDYCIENSLDVPPYVIHSANGVGARNIESVFHTYRKAKKAGII